MLFRKLLLVSLVATLGFSAASAEDAKPAMMGMEGMSYPMQKSMDPQVMMQMMTMMMDPAKAASMENCALCHEGDDLARYAKDFGPAYRACTLSGRPAILQGNNLCVLYLSLSPALEAICLCH